ncbi:MAG: hypothetical protein IAG10_21490 [Planctomycetaceae bacterium]|nr:hypothetical protein [Planctomycetaceae bacterium]
MPVPREWRRRSGNPPKADQPPQSAFGGLDGLRLYGIHFPDVHLGNIRVRN